MDFLQGKTPAADKVAELLKKKGIISTLQRIEIAQALLDRRQHLSAEQVLAKVSRASNGRALVSKATIYNTLRLFADKGLIKEIFADPTKVFYEPVTTDHHHFFFTETQTLEDIDPESIKLEKAPNAPEGMQVTGVDVIIRLSPQPQA